MKAYDILDALGEIDTALLASCEDYTAARRARRKMLMRSAAGLCAVLLLAVGIGSVPALRRAFSDAFIITEDSAAEAVQTEAVAESITVTNQSSTAGGLLEDSISAVPPAELADAAKPEESPMYSAPTDIPASDDAVITVPTMDGADIPKKDKVEEEVECEDAPTVDEAEDEVPDGDAYNDKILASESETTPDALQILPVEELQGMYGFEGILLYEYDVYCNYNLLDMYGMPETLPVYKNLAEYDARSDSPVYLSDDTMLAMGKEYASQLGLDVLSYETSYTWDEEDVPGDFVRLQTTNGKITVDGSGFVRIQFEEELPLSGGHTLSSDVSDQAAQKTVASLWEQYGMLIDGTIGQYAVTRTRTYDGASSRTYSVFSLTDDVQQNYFNASFAKMWFTPGKEDGNLRGFSIRNHAGALESLGNYPLISEDEAVKRLLDGYYVTTVPANYLSEDGITEDAILCCELEYRVSGAEKYYLPYYHFYVRLDGNPEKHAEGLESYGGFWVPAVQAAYLDPDTVWDGRFN